METKRPKRNIQPFAGEKYAVWKFRIRALLSEMDLIKVIDEEPPKEQNEQWNKTCRTAKSVIIEYLSDSFLCFAKDESTPKMIIKSLDALYERKSIATQLALRKKLLALKLQGDIPLVSHFTTFDELISELLAAGAKLDETDKVSHLLLTLPSNYDGVITAIETLSEDNLTLAFVKTRLLDHEVKLKSDSTDTSTKVLHVEQYKQQNFNHSNSSTNYDHKRHQNKYKMTRKSQFVKCHYCGRKGHYKNDCYYYKNTQNRHKNQTRSKTVHAAQLNEESTPAPDEFSGFAFMTGDYEQEDERSENRITFLLDWSIGPHHKQGRFLLHLLKLNHTS